MVEGGVKNVGRRDVAASLPSTSEMGVATVLLVVLVPAPSTSDFSTQTCAVILCVDFFKLPWHNSLIRGVVPVRVLLVISMGVFTLHCMHLLSDSRVYLCSD